MAKVNAKKVFDATSRMTDTCGTKINRAETGRVISCFFRGLRQEFGGDDVAAIQFLVAQYAKANAK